MHWNISKVWDEFLIFNNCVHGRAHRDSTVGLLLLQRFRVGLLLSIRLVSSQ